MLIAHARRCEGCFLGSRAQLDRLGFDEPTLDRICVDPDALPLGDRERAFVKFALKTAAGAADLTAADFEEMASHGFSKAEVLEVVGFVAFWTMSMVITSAVFAGLAAEER